MNRTAQQLISFAIPSGMALALIGAMYAPFAFTFNLLYSSHVFAMSNVLPTFTLCVVFALLNMLQHKLATTFLALASIYAGAYVLVWIILNLAFGAAVTWWHPLPIMAMREIMAFIIGKTLHKLGKMN